MTKRKTDVSEPYKNVGGRPPYQPNDKDRAVVESLTAYGASAEHVAIKIGISRTTLFKYYARELEVSHIEANAAVAQTAYQMAKSGKVPAMTMFWLKTQACWRETNHLQHSGAVGTYDLSNLSDEQLTKLEAILGPLTDRRSDQDGTGAPAFVPSVESDSIT